MLRLALSTNQSINLPSEFCIMLLCNYITLFVIKEAQKKEISNFYLFYLTCLADIGNLMSDSYMDCHHYSYLHILIK